ncbi:hyaluronoglucosaminidase [Nesidiocoris tenuis]|uniref:Hyaluronidase n=1 Tax=Nesidiocoris tenuis TaxID=355587 RepID=A0ABN7ALU2_9HEMI|nr:hyaluronoglucosaminidase [Nesidiocoris tenuis]
MGIVWPAPAAVALVIVHMASSASGFDIFWNAPTEMCHKHGFNFSQLGTNGIKQNVNDSFKGNRMVILYDPGLFPAILDSGDRNGGVPQEGNLDLHLRKFATDLQEAIPSADFDGVGVIDFEHWRPIWRENWSKLDIYRQRSKDIEKMKNPFASKSFIEKQAISRFEKAAYAFIDASLSMARQLRPKARWGYYAFPYCFNFTPKNNYMKCTVEVKEDNDRSYWMWKTGSALFPSAYIHEKLLPDSKRAKMIEGRTAEGVRVAKKKNPPLPVYIYISYKYQDTGAFLSKTDLKNSIEIPRRQGASGVVIWGSSKDTNSAQKCSKLNDYVDSALLPIAGKAGKSGKQSSNDVLDWFQ